MHGGNECISWLSLQNIVMCWYISSFVFPWFISKSVLFQDFFQDPDVIGNLLVAGSSGQQTALGSFNTDSLHIEKPYFLRKKGLEPMPLHIKDRL